MIKAFFIGDTSNKKNIDWALKFGANVIFTGHKNLEAPREWLNRLSRSGGESENIKLYVEIGLFAGEELWKKYPDCRPVDEEGNFASKIHWYHGVCPNHPEVRKGKFQLIKSIIENYDIDGLWLDIIRYPCRWEEVRGSKITEYCFCPICLEKFKNDTGVADFNLRPNERAMNCATSGLRGINFASSSLWIQWKCDQITNFVADVRDLIDRSGKDVKLGMFSVPWKEADFNGAIKKIIGQDFKRLAKYIDVFSPMVYHKMCSRTTEWIHEIVAYMTELTKKPILPIIQAEDKPAKINRKEFAKAVNQAARFPSQGWIIFFLEDLLKDRDKVKVMSSL